MSNQGVRVVYAIPHGTRVRINTPSGDQIEVECQGVLSGQPPTSGGDPSSGGGDPPKGGKADPFILPPPPPRGGPVVTAYVISEDDRSPTIAVPWVGDQLASGHFSGIRLSEPTEHSQLLLYDQQSAEYRSLEADAE